MGGLERPSAFLAEAAQADQPLFAQGHAQGLPITPEQTGGGH